MRLTPKRANATERAQDTNEDDEAAANDIDNGQQRGVQAVVWSVEAPADVIVAVLAETRLKLCCV